MPALKVYRTPIGFHDAYVAAPSQKAALRAWGAEADLFARGVAELVTDPALAAEPLARPGEVIRKLRGTAAEQFAALPPDLPRAAGAKRDARKAAPKPTPPPSRADLDAAEAALGDALARQRAEDADLTEREAALRREREELRRRHEAEARRLQRVRDDAREAYDAALARWTA